MYQRVVLTIIALSLVLLTLRLYAPFEFTRFLARHGMRGYPVYVVNNSPIEVEVTGLPLEVEVTNSNPIGVEVMH
jgi:hypothetical protein